MNVRHYITIDRGTGPVSFVRVEKEGVTTMLRITHNARFDRVKEVDPIATAEAVAASTDLGSATTKVGCQVKESMTAEVLAWCARNGSRQAALRWDEDGSALFFESDAVAAAWDQSDDRPAVDAPRRRRLMG